MLPHKLVSAHRPKLGPLFECADEARAMQEDKMESAFVKLSQSQDEAQPRVASRASLGMATCALFLRNTS